MVLLKRRRLLLKQLWLLPKRRRLLLKQLWLLPKPRRLLLKPRRLLLKQRWLILKSWWLLLKPWFPALYYRFSGASTGKAQQRIIKFVGPPEDAEAHAAFAVSPSEYVRDMTGYPRLHSKSYDSPPPLQMESAPPPHMQVQISGISSRQGTNCRNSLCLIVTMTILRVPVIHSAGSRNSQDAVHGRATPSG